jgi:hypothetical protein
MTVNQAAVSYRGAGKTDAKDAYVIADQARMRRDLTVLRPDDELIVELRVLVARRGDLAGDRVRAVNRLHNQLPAVCPALDRVLELTNRGPLVLLTGFQTPAALREAGADRVQAWLRARGRGRRDAQRGRPASHTTGTLHVSGRRPRRHSVEVGPTCPSR